MCVKRVNVTNETNVTIPMYVFKKFFFLYYLNILSYYTNYIKYSNTTHPIVTFVMFDSIVTFVTPFFYYVITY